MSALAATRPGADDDPAAWAQDVRDQLHGIVDVLAVHNDQSEMQDEIMPLVLEALSALRVLEALVRERGQGTRQ